MATPSEQPSLTVLSGSKAGTVFVVDDSVDNVLIGSDASCRFSLPDTGVDPIHARLWIDLEGITVYDTDSPRGIYINDDRVEGQSRLRNGDILWLGAPGDDASVMLQCRIPSAPEVEPTIAMRASDLPVEPTVAMPPLPAPEPEPEAAEVEPELVADPEAEAEPESEPEPEPTRAFSIDDTPPPPALPPATLLAPDAIQPEPTVMMAPDDDAFIVPEPEPTVSMLPDDDELAPVTLDPDPEPDADATLSLPEPVKPPAAAGGWDPLAGGITAAADAPWLAGAPAVPASFDPSATIAAQPLSSAPSPVAAPPPAATPPPALPPPAPRAAAVVSTPAAAVASARPTPPPPRAPEPPPVAKARREPAPTAPAPRPRREPPAAPPPSAADDDDFRPPRKGAPMGLLIGGALAAAVVVGAGAWWMLKSGQPAAEPGTAPPPTVAQARPAPAPVAPGEQPPATVAPAEVPVEEEVTIVPRAQPSASPLATPSKAPSAAPSPVQVAKATPPPAPAGPAPAVVAAGLVGRAETARKSGDLDSAADLFDQALQADAGNAAATAGKTAVAAARAAARKAFMPGRTVVQTQAAKADLSGFDTADVSVKKAPDFSGRIEFAVNPARVKPGDSYSVQVFLVNEGKKPIKISAASAITNVNGSKSPRPLSPRVKEVAPAQRALLDEMPGVWGDDVNWWSAEVTVAANKGDSLKNTLNWK
jgi:hypothetical protein